MPEKSASQSKAKAKSKTRTKKPKLIIITDTSPKTQPAKPKQRTLKKKKRKLKLVEVSPEKEKSISKMPTLRSETQTKPNLPKPPYNKQFIDLLGQLESYMNKKGEGFRARAYQKAQESIMIYPEDITKVSQIAKLKGIGKTITSKLDEYLETGKINAIEKEKVNPLHIFTDIYGIGPKKAKELIALDITTIPQLKEKENLLNRVQKIGLEYYDDIVKRIPRSEIDTYQNVFQQVFNTLGYKDASMDIVGSYRRGLTTSGDIDVIITDKENKSQILHDFIDKLIEKKIILHKLTDGKTKILVIAQLPGKPARRVDFLYSSPVEYPFAVLYFTGSKIFNTVMRQKALDLDYTLNEHGIYHMVSGKKGKKIDLKFNDEKDIFDFLNLQYKKPVDRKDGRAVQEKKDEKKTKVSDKPIIVAPSTTVKKVSESKPSPPKTIFKTRTPQSKKISPKEFSQKVEKIVKAPQTSISDAEKNINEFKKSGIKVLKALNKKEIEDMVKHATDVYYNNPDEGLLSDDQFDIIKEYLEKKYPKSKQLKEIGASVKKNKVVLPYNMPSMDKIKPTTNALTKWLAKYNVPKKYTISAKLDGVSGLYTTEGLEPKLYTRGDGTIGQDISYLIPHLSLPDKKDLVIRGEFIISKSNFTKHFKEQKNARNTVAGMTNKITIDPKIKYVDFVAYELIKPSLSPDAQMKFLEKLTDLKVVKNETLTNITNDILSDLLIDWREKYAYDIDGIIVAHDKIYPRGKGNPDHAFAFKMVLSDQVAEAKVVDVIWKPSKDGLIKPKIQIEPIELGGTKIEFATGFNAAFIKKNNIGVGAIVGIVRAGDVIPHVEKVIKPASEPLMPDIPYIWSKTNVDILLKDEDKESNMAVREKNIAGFFKNIGVEGLSTGTVAALMKAGYDTVPKIIKMTKNDFLELDGFKEKRANKIYNIHR